jgi:predicted kinase
MPHLIVIYGAPLTGKSSLARAVAQALGDKSAVVSVDGLLDDAIRVHDRDAFAELEMVYTQARLLVANYLKNRYHVVLEGTFLHEREGVVHAREQEIDQIQGLMRNLALSPLTVRLTAAEPTLRLRAEAAQTHRDLAALLRIDAAYRSRYGSRALELSTDEARVEDLAAEVLRRLQA